MKRLWYMTAFCLIAIGVVGVASFDWNGGDKDMIEYEEKWTYSAEELRDLSIKSDYSVNMTFERSTDGRNSIHLTGRGTEQMIAKVRETEISDGSLRLELVRLPKRYIQLFNFDFGNQNRQHLVVSVTDDALLDRLKLKLDSGSIRLTDAAYLPISAAELATDSGSVSLDNFRSETLNVDIDSGSINANNVTANLTASTDSGSIKIEGLTGPANIDVDSGSVRLTKLDNADTRIKTDSGSVFVRVPEGFAGSYDVKADSGRVRYPETKPETTDYVKIRTGSGSITVEEASR